MMNQPKPERRRRFALSLRSLMILVLVVGGFLGWKARRASIQRAAVAKITAAGGSVQFDYQINSWKRAGKWVANPPHPWAPGWLRKSIGEEHFQEGSTVFLQNLNPNAKIEHDPTLYEALMKLDRVEQVNTVRYPLDDQDFARLMAMPRLSESFHLDVDVTDAGLESVASSPAIESLVLRSNQPGSITGQGLASIARQTRLKKLGLISIGAMSPADMEPLAKLTQLEFLRIQKSPVDEACLRPLRNLRMLKYLCLQETQLTDVGAESLANLELLERLDMDGSKLTDAGLARLANHHRLTSLWLLNAPRITDAGLASLEKLGSMAELILPQSKVTDAGIEHLKGMKLENLEISGEGVTDAGLATLQQIPTLKFLNLVGTNITARGRAAFRKARPGVTIQGGPSDPDPED